MKKKQPASPSKTTAEISPEFRALFTRLRAMLERHAQAGCIRHEKSGYYWLEMPPMPKLKRAFWIGGVQIGKNYVSYHFMPVYISPALLKDSSTKLKARQQGKACFNFRTVDEPLLAELTDLTARGFSGAAKAGYIPA